MKKLITTFIAVLLANMVSMMIFFYVASWWVHDIADKAFDRHVSTQFSKAVKAQTKKLLEILNEVEELREPIITIGEIEDSNSKPAETDYDPYITPKLRRLRETSSQPTEKLKRLRGQR